MNTSTFPSEVKAASRRQFEINRAGQGIMVIVEANILNRTDRTDESILNIRIDIRISLNAKSFHISAANRAQFTNHLHVLVCK